MLVFDSSAILAYLLEERGASHVRERLGEGGACGAANWSEVAQKSRSRGLHWGRSRALLLGFGVYVEPATEADAESAALLWAGDGSLSLADRLCLALGVRLDATVVTCDRAWEGMQRVELAR